MNTSELVVSAVREIVGRNLTEGTCEIVFTKADKSTRVMKCTRNLVAISEHTKEVYTPSDIIKPTNPFNLAVFDVESKSWKSVNLDKIQQFNRVPFNEYIKERINKQLDAFFSASEPK